MNDRPRTCALFAGLYLLAGCAGKIEDADPGTPTTATSQFVRNRAGSFSRDRSSPTQGNGVGDGSDNHPGSSSDPNQVVALGGHLRGISDPNFAAAKANFQAVEGVNDGLGPIFNEAACGNCHSLGAIGGGGAQIERRFGRFDNGAFNPLANEGGSLRQLMTLGSWTNARGKACSVPLEKEPADATIKNVGRLTTPLFGLGLIDAMPDSFFKDLQGNQASDVRGTVNVVSIVLPDPTDSSQRIGGQRVGRFGWKAGVPNLVQFAADAYLNEMAITTQHCFRGTSITAFATESAPNGSAIAPGCEDNKPGIDDEVGPCDDQLTEIQEDVANFNAFMTFLAPPARERSDNDADLEASDANAPPGRKLFDKARCADCHVRQAFVTPDQPANGVPGGRRFRPFSDFLLHDMGSLGDQIGSAGDSQATTRRMRTAPLWGIRFRPRLLHDGRASDVGSAIGAHDGQGAVAAKAFNQLGSADKQTLVQFVLSL